jgi:hypothetical protein
LQTLVSVTAQIEGIGVPDRFGSVLVALLHGCCTRVSLLTRAPHMHSIAHHCSAAIPVVIKGISEMMNLGIALKGIASRVVEPRRPPVAHLIVDV